LLFTEQLDTTQIVVKQNANSIATALILSAHNHVHNKAVRCRDTLTV